MRQGENALDVIGRVKEKIRQIEPGLPEGVKIVPVYDRSQLIRHSIDTLKSTVIEVIITVCLVVLLFLWHIPSALIPMITIPVAVLIAFIPFRAMGITANIMSLGGIAIAIGAMVDASIVVVEQAHKKLEAWEASGRRGDYREVVIEAVKEVGGPSFFALLVIAVSFIPVLRSGGAGRAAVQAAGLHEEPRHDRGRGAGHHARPGAAALFHPPARLQLPAALAVEGGERGARRAHPFRGRPPGQPAPDPALRAGLPLVAAPQVGGDRRRRAVLFVVTVPVFFALGSEFMPPLYEEALFYMPSTMPGISIGEAQRAAAGHRPADQGSSRKWTACWARPAAPRRPRTRRRSRCWRR